MVMQKEFITVDESTGQEVIKLESLPKDLKKQVESLYKDVLDAQQECGRSGLKLGQALKTARDTLRPYGLWEGFLGRLPGISASTARRMIEAFESAKEKLPELVLALATGAGMAIHGTKNAPYGKYTDAVERVGPPPKESNRDSARDWLIEDEAERRRQRIQQGQVKPDKATLLRSLAIKATLKAVKAIEGKEQQVMALQTIIGEVAKILSLADKVAKKESKAGIVVTVGPVLLESRVQAAQ